MLTVHTLGRYLLRRKTPMAYTNAYFQFLRNVIVVGVDQPIGTRSARIANALGRQKRRLSVPHLIVAATALERGQTLVTDDADYQLVPGLSVADWAVP